MFEIIQSMILKWSYKNVMVWSTLIPMCTVSLGFSPFRFEYNDNGDGDDDDDCSICGAQCAVAPEFEVGHCSTLNKNVFFFFFFFFFF